LNNKGKEVTESNGITFIGEKGKHLRQPRLRRQRARWHPEGADQRGRQAPCEERGHRENWLDCIKTRQKPICDVAIGAGSVTVCHLVNSPTGMARS